MTRCEAPWTDDQVASLNAYQSSGRMHPFTHGDGDSKVDLVATRDGWVAAPGGPVVQAWAHQFMANWRWKDAAYSPDFPSDTPVKCAYCDSMTTTGMCASCASERFEGLQEQGHGPDD